MHKVPCRYPNGVSAFLLPEIRKEMKTGTILERKSISAPRKINQQLETKQRIDNCILLAV